MHDDTLIGGTREEFPVTQHSAIVAISSQDPKTREQAYGDIISAYWKPVYKFIRLKWHKSNEDAKDLTQAFFTRVMEKEFFSGYNPARARFRTYLRICLDGFVANEEKAATRLKRGGDARILSLDFEGADGEMVHAAIPTDNPVEEYFDKEWVRHIFGIAVEGLKEHYSSTGTSLHFQIFQLYHLDDSADAGTPTYEEIATRFNISVSTVTNHLASARREFRKIVLGELRKVTSTDLEFRQEARELLGIDPS